ncbi:MAG: hypothetical protein ACOYLQ_12230 [Hyphomicrobiaceae bacterium]
MVGQDVPVTVQDAARWAVEREIEQRQAAIEGASRIGRQMVTAVLLLNGAGALLTFALFIGFVAFEGEIAPAAAAALSWPMTWFAVGLLAATVSGLLAYAAQLLRSEMFMAPWEQIDIYIVNNETAFKAFLDRRMASLTWFHRLLMGAAAACLIAVVLFGWAAVVTISQAGAVAAQLPPRPAPRMSPPQQQPLFIPQQLSPPVQPTRPPPTPK